MHFKAITMTDKVQSDSHSLLNLLSESRLGSYRDYVRLHYPHLSPDDEDRLTLLMHRWNVETSAKTMAYIAYVEIFVRNAIDRELRRWLSTQVINGFPDWISPQPSDPIGRIRSLVNTADRDYLEAARISALNKQRQWKADQTHPRHGDSLNRNDVFAQLNFGTWDGMLGRADRDPELANVLMDAFPCIESAWAVEQRRMPKASLPGTDHDSRTSRLRKELAARLRSIRNIRNRAGHEDNLLRVDFPQLRHNMLFVLGAIDPKCINWAFPDAARDLKTMNADNFLANTIRELNIENTRKKQENDHAI